MGPLTARAARPVGLGRGSERMLLPLRPILLINLVAIINSHDPSLACIYMVDSSHVGLLY